MPRERSGGDFFTAIDHGFDLCSEQVETNRLECNALYPPLDKILRNPWLQDTRKNQVSFVIRPPSRLVAAVCQAGGGPDHLGAKPMAEAFRARLFVRAV